MESDTTTVKLSVDGDLSYEKHLRLAALHLLWSIPDQGLSECLENLIAIKKEFESQ